jgi:hypothetical protein
LLFFTRGSNRGLTPPVGRARLSSRLAALATAAVLAFVLALNEAQ